MALVETVEHTITIRDNGVVEWRKDRVIYEADGVSEVTRTHWRTSLEPGQDVSVLPTKVKVLCNFVWTPAVIAAYIAAKAARLSAI